VAFGESSLVEEGGTQKETKALFIGRLAEEHKHAKTKATTNGRGRGENIGGACHLS